MNKINFLSIILLSLFIVTSTGCKKKGCTDKNSDNYNSDAKKNDASCVYRYASGITITPPKGIYQPIDGNDRYLRFAKKSSSTWNTSGFGADSIFIALSVPNVMFTNEDWKFELYDHNNTTDHLITSGIFNPLIQGSGGRIIVNGSVKIVTFNYITK